MQDTKQPEPFPTLLTKSDAMLFCATRMEEMVGHMKMTASLSKVADQVAKRFSADPEVAQATKSILISASGIVDVDLQEKAMRAAAAEIRAMANEIKLADARAAESGIKIKPNS